MLEPPSLNSTCHLNDGAQGYRLADMLTSRFFRHGTGGIYFHKNQYPNSFATRFAWEYCGNCGAKYGRLGSPKWRAFYANTSCLGRRCVKAGFCQCFVTPAIAILDMITEDEAAAKAKGSAGSPRLPNTAAVHLRVGDVIESSPFTLDQMLQERTRFWNRCNGTVGTNKCGAQGVSLKVYVTPLREYARVCERLVMLNLTSVVLVAASHVALPSYAKSCEYVSRVAAYFRARGFRVTLRLGQPPDEDLRFMVRCGAFVPSGASGFAQLAAQLVHMRGGRVIMPMLARGAQQDKVREIKGKGGGGDGGGGGGGGGGSGSGDDQGGVGEALWGTNLFALSRWWETPLQRQRYALGRPNVRVAVCVSGRGVDRERRSFASLASHVWKSQRDHLIEPLRLQADVESFYVLDGESDAKEAELLRVARQEFKARAVRFVNVTEVQVKAQVAQFVRLEACKEVITEREAKGGWKFDWVIRTRPDLFFYAGSMGHDGGRVADGAVPRPSGSSRGGRLPLLSTLDTGAVHARMRCYGFPNASFTEQHISADNHHVLRRACGSRPTECDCTRIQPGCPPNAVRVDDSFAIVPRALMARYFAMHSAVTTDGVATAAGQGAPGSVGASPLATSPTTRDPCPPWQPDGKCLPGCHARPECLMTRSLMEQASARISPTPLFFAIARTRGKKWGAGARFNSGSLRLFLSSPLRQGQMDDQALVSYRCREPVDGT